jgi:hypothetical protein
MNYVPFVALILLIAIQLTLGGIAWGSLRTEVRHIGKQLDHLTRRFESHEKESRVCGES